MVNAAIPIEQGQEYQRASGAEADLIPEDNLAEDNYQQGQEIRESANQPQGSEHVSPESKAMEPQGSPQQLPQGSPQQQPEDPAKLNLPDPAYTDEDHTSGHERQPEPRIPNPQPAYDEPQPQPAPVPCGPCEQLHPSSAAGSPYMPAATGYTRSPQQSPMGSPAVNERLPDGAIVSYVGQAEVLDGGCAFPPGDYRQDGNNWVQLQNNAVPTAAMPTLTLE